MNTRRKPHKNNTNIIKIVVFFSVLSNALNVKAASYNCETPTLTVVEQSICTDRSLSKLDSKLSKNYNSIINIWDKLSISKIQSSQRDWIKIRNNCEDSINLRLCLKKEYIRRNNYLDSLHNFITSSKKCNYKDPIDHTFCRMKWTIPKNNKIMLELWNRRSNDFSSYISFGFHLKSNCPIDESWTIELVQCIYSQYIKLVDNVNANNEIPISDINKSKEANEINLSEYEISVLERLLWEEHEVGYNIYSAVIFQNTDTKYYIFRSNNMYDTKLFWAECDNYNCKLLVSKIIESCDRWGCEKNGEYNVELFENSDSTELVLSISNILNQKKEIYHISTNGVQKLKILLLEEGLNSFLKSWHSISTRQYDIDFNEQDPSLKFLSDNYIKKIASVSFDKTVKFNFLSKRIQDPILKFIKFKTNRRGTKIIGITERYVLIYDLIKDEIRTKYIERFNPVRTNISSNAKFVTYYNRVSRSYEVLNTDTLSVTNIDFPVYRGANATQSYQAATSENGKWSVFLGNEDKVYLYDFESKSSKIIWHSNYVDNLRIGNNKVTAFRSIKDKKIIVAISSSDRTIKLGQSIAGFDMTEEGYTLYATGYTRSNSITRYSIDRSDFNITEDIYEIDDEYSIELMVDHFGSISDQLSHHSVNTLNGSGRYTHVIDWTKVGKPTIKEKFENMINLSVSTDLNSVVFQYDRAYYNAFFSNSSSNRQYLLGFKKKLNGQSLLMTAAYFKVMDSRRKKQGEYYEKHMHHSFEFTEDKKTILFSKNGSVDASYKLNHIGRFNATLGLFSWEDKFLESDVYKDFYASFGLSDPRYFKSKEIVVNEKEIWIALEVAHSKEGNIIFRYFNRETNEIEYYDIF